MTHTRQRASNRCIHKNRSRTKRLALLPAGALLAAVLCLQAGCDFLQLGPPWNFLVYMSADNNLETAALADLNEMEMIGSTDQVAVFVLLDRSPYYDNSNGDWTGTRLYRVTRDFSGSTTITSELLEDYGELDMSDPATLRNFILYCHALRPAPFTCLTLWNHGAGVYPRSIAPVAAPATDTDITRGICLDDTTGSECFLTTDETAQALSEARAITGVPIDVINMDACLMQMLEIGWEWRAEAGYLAGSQTNVPGNGNNYALVLNHLNTTTVMTPRDLANLLVNDFYAAYSGSEYNRAYSAISLGAEFDDVRTAFTAFAAALRNTADLAGVEDSWDNSVSMDPNYLEYKDLYEFAYFTTLYVGDTAVTTAAAALMSALSNAVVNHCATNAFIGRTHGVGVLLPATDLQWSKYSAPDRYPDFPVCEETDWDEFIDVFLDFTR